MKTIYDIFPNIDDIRKPEHFPDIKSETFWKIFKKYEPYSMIGIEAFYNIYKSVEYIVKNYINGDFVECGVFLGGSVMVAAEFLNHFEGSQRQFFLFDTFEGFPENTRDIDIEGNEVIFYKHQNFLKVVEENLTSCNYDIDKFKIISGPVEETLMIERNLPECIAFLRLDTDYYQSTKIELQRLYPKLTKRGLCTIDDYGTFQGAKKATDEYFAMQQDFPMIFRVNGSVRVLMKA